MIEESNKELQYLIEIYDQEMENTDFLKSVVNPKTDIDSETQQGRFAKLSEEDLNKVLSDSTSKATKTQTSSQIKNFKSKKPWLIVELEFFTIRTKALDLVEILEQLRTKLSHQNGCHLLIFKEQRKSLYR